MIQKLRNQNKDMTDSVRIHGVVLLLQSSYLIRIYYENSSGVYEFLLDDNGYILYDLNALPFWLDCDQLRYYMYRHFSILPDH